MKHSRARLLVGFFFAVFWLLGCATTVQVDALRENPAADLPARVELVDVPFYPQQEFHCGPAAMAAIFNFHGYEVTPEALGDRMVVPNLEGSLQAEVIAAVRSYDLVPFPQDGRLLSLMRELAQGNPVFVLQNLGLDSLPVWHYELLIGYDLEAEVMILRSDVHRRIERDFEVFETVWTRAGNWSLVVVPPTMIPSTISQADFLDEAIAFEQLGRMTTARMLYDNATLAWPDNPVAWLGKGNLSYQVGDFATAEVAYRRSLRIDARQAALWNNLAFSLVEQGKQQQAIDAIARAVRLDPDNVAYRNSQQEILNW